MATIKIPLTGFSKEKRWVPRKKEYRRYRVIVDYALISEEDYEKVSNITWYKNSHGYAQTDRPKRLLMHQLITNYDITDHIDRNPLNNTRENLRPCTSKENQANTGPKTGKYKGVSYCKQTNKFRAAKRHGSKNVHLGRFDTEKEAAIAYNNYVTKLPTSEFEYINKIEEEEEV